MIMEVSQNFTRALEFRLGAVLSCPHTVNLSSVKCLHRPPVLGDWHSLFVDELSQLGKVLGPNVHRLLGHNPVHNFIAGYTKYTSDIKSD